MSAPTVEGLLHDLRVARMMYADVRHSVLVETLIDHAGWSREQMLEKAKALVDNWDSSSKSDRRFT